MERGLFVVLEANETEQELFQEAAVYSESHNAPLDVLRLVSPEDIQSVESADVTSDIDRAELEDPIDRQFEEETEAFVQKALDGTASGYEIDIRIEPDAERATAILDVAEQQDYDHVFLVGTRRSPTGKALFGDLTQEIILNFDGQITLSMD